MADLSTVTTLVFDVLGTLLDEDAGHLAAAERTVGADAPGFVSGWQEAYRDRVLAVREGRRPYATAEVLGAEAVATVAADRGLDLTDPQVEQLVMSGRHLEPFPDVVEALSRLAAGHALVALTTAGSAQAFAMSRFAGLRWTTMISADIVQAYKPDPQTYRYLLHELQLDPDECLFVAAHPWDLAAAARHGFRTAYVDRAHSSPAELAAHARRFDHVVTDLTTLLDRLSPSS